MNDRNAGERLDRLEGHVRNIDQRLERVEQILPTLATKEDLKAFVTKEDAKTFATKDDLKGMPTVDDPKGFVTKTDLEAFGEREAAAMRAFVLEVVQKSTADLRNEMRVLFEEQRTWFLALMDQIKSVRDLAVSIDVESRARDTLLERRIRGLERR